MTAKKSPHGSRWIWIAAAAGALALVAAWHFLPLNNWLQALEERISGLGLLGAIAYGAVCIAALLLFVPASILTMLAPPT